MQYTMGRRLHLINSTWRANLTYEKPLTIVWHILFASRAVHLSSHSAKGVPRCLIIHACAHEISWLLPTVQSLQQKPASLHSRLQNSMCCCSAEAAAMARS